MEHEPRQRIEAPQLQERHEKRERKLGQVLGSGAEAARELVHLDRCHLPPLVRILHPSMVRGDLDDPEADLRHDLREEADGKKRPDLDNLEAEEQKRYEPRCIDIGVHEPLPPEEEHESSEDALSCLVDDEAGVLDSTCRSDRKPCPHETVDLGRRAACAVRRQVREEDARRLDAHEVADAQGALRVLDDSKDIGKDTEEVVDDIGETGCRDPALIYGAQGRHELPELPREDKVGHIDDSDDSQKDDALAHGAHALLLFSAALRARDLRLHLHLRLCRHACSCLSPQVTHFLPGLLQMLPLALEFLEEIRTIAGKLGLADTRYFEHPVLRLGTAADHGTKRRI